MSLFFNDNKTEKRSIGFQDVFGTVSNVSTGDLNEASYLTVLEYISKSIAKLKLEVLDVDLENGAKIPNKSNDWAYTLSTRFNKTMTAYNGLKTFIEFGLHNGISALFIDKVEKELYPVKVQSLIVDTDGLISTDKDNPILYTCSLANETFDCLDRDLIVFKFGFTLDGVKSKSIRELSKNTINSLKEGQSYLNKIYKNGGLGKIAIQTTSTIEDKKLLLELQNRWNALYTNSDNKVFTIPAGYTLQSLSNSLSDNDFMNIRSLIRKELCASFGLPSTVLNDYDGISYSSLEQLQLQIYSDCLQPILEQLQQEFSYKLLGRVIDKVIEFDEDGLFKFDYETRVNMLTKLKDKSILSANGVLRELGYKESDSEYADELVLTSGYLPESLAKVYYTNKVGVVEGGEIDGNTQIGE